MSTDQKNRILGAACDLYLDQGFDGFSMRRLARTVGVTAPALYRHFESKEGVLHEVIGEAYRRLSESIFRALEGSTPLERFQRAAEGYVRFALENSRLYEVIFLPPRVIGVAQMPPGVEAQACAIGTFWDDRVRECIEAGVLAEGDPTDLSRTLWAHAHGLIILQLRGRLDPERGFTNEEFLSLFRASADRLMRGLGGPGWPGGAGADEESAEEEKGPDAAA